MLKASLFLVAGVLIGFLLGINMDEFASNKSGVANLADGAKTSSEVSKNKIKQLKTATDFSREKVSANDKVPSQQAAKKNTPRDSQSPSEKFKSLLDRYEYDEAVSYFEDVTFINASLKPELKSLLLSRLDQFQSKKNFLRFSQLTEAWLAVYFDDIDVLVNLAEHDIGQDYRLEAISIYHQASEYAKNQREVSQIKDSLAKSVSAVSNRLKNNGNNYELQSFYEQLLTTDLAQPVDKLALAQLYADASYIDEARRLLGDISKDPKVGTQARSLLAELRGNTQETTSDGVELALQRKGAHFIAGMVLSDNHRIRLMMDTGASMTTLSKSVFDEIQGSLNLELLETRLFRTANGVTRGEVYRVYDNQFADFRLNSTDIAVLNYPPSEGIDGLLGMNVLSLFRFQLDQDKPALILREK